MQLMLDRYIVGKRTNANMNIDAVRRLLDANGIGDGQDSLSHSDDDVLHRLAEPMLYQPQSLATVPFPVEGQTANFFYTGIIKSMFPLMFIVAFLYTQKKVIADLIVEKESKVRESLRMIGVSNVSIILSWYATYATIFFGLALIFTCLATRSIFPHSSILLTTVFFWLGNQKLQK